MPSWDDDVPLEEKLAPFPGAQIQITIPERVAGTRVINHIDLSTVLRQTVSCDLYSNLVTRPTGAAVRDADRKQLLAELGERSLTVIDFSHVGMIDFSCADESRRQAAACGTSDGARRARRISSFAA